MEVHITKRYQGVFRDGNGALACRTESLVSHPEKRY
ncbi:unnamed protein product, partial [marine sediment metagenome]